MEAFAYDDADYHVTPATLHGVTLTLDVLMQGLYRRGVGGEAYSLDDVEDVLLAASGHSFSDVIDGYVVHNGDFLALFGSNPTFTTLR